MGLCLSKDVYIIVGNDVHITACITMCTSLWVMMCVAVHIIFVHQSA